MGHLIPDFRNIMENFGWGIGFLLCSVVVILNLLLPYNIVLYITERRLSRMDFMKQQVLIFFCIVLITILANAFLNYLMNDGTRYIKYSVVWSFYMAGFGSLIYLFT
ncbi:MAG TPA: hypothetical protein VEB42_04535, partial [Chitinophagaceae bacterium]|nr:hypothetical protein [Chitinophagaceae bacterium]